MRILRGYCALNKLTISILDLLQDAVDLVGCRLYLSILSLHMPQSLLQAAHHLDLLFLLKISHSHRLICPELYSINRSVLIFEIRVHPALD